MDPTRVRSNALTALIISYYLKEMARRRLKMTKKAIAARRRYRQKKKKKGRGFAGFGMTGVDHRYDSPAAFRRFVESTY